MNQMQATAPRGLDIGGFLDKLNPVVGLLDCRVAARPQPFACSIERVSLGALDVLRYDGQGLQTSRRGPVHIRESRVDSFFATFPLTAPMALTQSGRMAVARPGSAVLLTTDQPFDCLFDVASDQTYAQLMLRIPGALLRRHVPHIDECCARTIALDHGAGRVLQRLVENLLDHSHGCSPTQAERFGSILLDTFANVAMEAPEWLACQGVREDVARTRLLARAQAFIESQLSDPELDPARVAAHCQISVRYLHAIFSAASLGVAAYIRDLRLQRCREALRNPQLRDRSVTEIAMRWGFGSSSSFNRAYRTRFGSAPSEDRILLLH